MRYKNEKYVRSEIMSDILFILNCDFIFRPKLLDVKMQMIHNTLANSLLYAYCIG
ncbi:hypothetical protein PFMC_04665, partial [Plasmodium falciparum CAMP/Malaysia]